MMKTSKPTILKQWERLPERPRRAAGWVLGLTLVAIYPVLDRVLRLQTLTAATDAMVFVVLALGLNIVVGYAGLLDLGYAAFFAIGAYTTGMLTAPLHGLYWNFWLVIWFCVIAAATSGLVIGAPSIRARGDYLAIVTLGFGEIVPVAFRNLDSISIPFLGLVDFNLTNGVQGINPVGRPAILGFRFGFDPLPWYYLIILIGGLVIYITHRLENSRLGRAWMAIREDETAADCMGVNPFRTKLLAFAMGASFSGFAGAFYAAKLQAIFPELFRFQVSIMILCMVILGGMGNIRGVVMGGLLITIFDRVILAQSTTLVRALGKVLNLTVLTTIDLSLWRWFFFGLALIIVMLLRPEGLFPSKARQAELRGVQAEERPPVIPEGNAAEGGREVI